METRAPVSVMPIAAIAEPKTKRGTAPTELPKPKTVEAAPKAAKAAADHKSQDDARRAEARERDAALRPNSQLKVMTHEATGSLVLQTRDSETGDVHHQFPNNATLKSRAIARYEALQGAPTIRRTI